MTKLLAVTAATFLALTGLPATPADAAFNFRIKLPADFSSFQKTGCYEDCDYDEVEHESEHERDDDEYDRPESRGYQQASRREQSSVRAEAKRPAIPEAVFKPAVAKTEPPRRFNAPSQDARSENSSITTADDRVAEVSAFAPRAAREVGCKKYIASAGVTLSVPCE